jgi:hypothetical protein
MEGRDEAVTRVPPGDWATSDLKMTSSAGPSMNRTFLGLLACATGVALLSAGGGTFRALVDLPARYRLGSIAFAEFSRATDLSRGLVYYPTEAIGGTLLIAATSWAGWRAGAPRLVRWLMAGALLSKLLILAITTQAASIMWRIGSSPNDAALREALTERFVSLTYVRIVLGDAAGIALLGALSACAMRKASTFR